MRGLVVLLGAVVSLSLVSVAAADPSLSITHVGSKVLYGHALSLSGKLSSDQSGHRVGIYAKQFGKQQMAWVASVVTGMNGRWGYLARPSILTTYEARSGTRTSATVSVGVEPRIDVVLLADGKVTTRVIAGRQFAGRKVELQQASGMDWRTLETATLGAGSEATFAAPTTAASATLRVAISVNETGAGYLGSQSHALTYRVRSVSLVPSTFTVLYRNSLVLSGRISSGASGQPVTILDFAYGRSAPSKLATVDTGAGGAWSVRTKPLIRTSYVARWTGNLSRTLVVGVEPRLSISLASGGILVHVAASRSLAGRKIELQELTGAKTWRTLDELHLDRQASAAFASPIKSGSATLRVAISVNQAGAGLLGSSSDTFLYHGH